MSDNFGVLAMHEHIMRLLDEYGIAHSWARRVTGWSIKETEEVVIPLIKSVVSYAVALHEIGHNKGKFQSSRSIMVRERWAWHWAKQNAMMWTRRMENRSCASLAAYEEHPERLIYRPTLTQLPDETEEQFNTRVREIVRKERSAARRLKARNSTGRKAKPARMRQ